MKKLAILIALLLGTLLFGCSLSIQKLAKRMLEKYSNNQNNVTLTGEVVEINKHNVLINCKELSDYLSYQSEHCYYFI